MQTAAIYIVSGGKGTAGERIVRTVLAQFEDADIPVILVGDIREKGQLHEAIARVEGTNSVIVHTLVDPNLRSTLAQLCHEHSIANIDLMGPLLAQLTGLLGRAPVGQPGRHVNGDYFRRIAAIEFTVEHDDGKRAHDLHLADIVLTGVSRVGKTPMSMYLSMQGWKVANVPLVCGVEPPAELFSIDKNRVVGLTIEPGQLAQFRRAREQRLKAGKLGGYSNAEALFADVDCAQSIFRRGGFAVLDVTDKPIEESAEQVMSIIARRTKGAVSNPKGHALEHID